MVGHSIKTATYRPASAFVRALASTGAVQIAGGPHVTVAPGELLRDRPEIALGVAGEAEETITGIVDRLAAGADAAGAPGTVALRDGALVRVEHEPGRGLDALPRPDFDLMPGVDFHARPYPIVTTRGCPYPCSFCAVGEVGGRRWRYRSATDVVDELEAAARRWGVRRFDVHDDNFTQSYRRAIEVCEELVRRDLDLTWTCGNGIRADRVRPDLAVAMRRAGCVLACVGVESADPEVFEAVDKGETLDDVRRGIRILKEAGIEVVGFFIVGLPGDTYERSQQALAFVEESGLDSARFGLLAPYPGMPAWSWVQQEARWLGDWKDGVHFGDELRPVFETGSFPGSAMLRAYERLNVKLGLFEFLVPDELPPFERKLAQARLLLRHDRPGLLRRIGARLPGIRSDLRGFRPAPRVVSA